MSAAAAMRAVIPLAHECDAFLVACYGDHALIRMLQEGFKQPTIELMEASLFAARTLGNRSGLNATSKRSTAVYEDSVIRQFGFDDLRAGVGSCNLCVLGRQRKRADHVQCCQRLDRQGGGLLGIELCYGTTELR